MTDRYERRIARAQELFTSIPEANEILGWYIHLTRFQKTVFDRLRARNSTNIDSLNEFIEPLRQLTSRLKPIDGTPELIAAFWAGDRTAPPDEQFFARVLLQPYAEYLATRGTPDTHSSNPVCPFCGSKPVAGVLRGEGDGAKRSLVCGLCSTEWLYRRIACPNCGETDKEKLPVFIAEQFNYIRVEACDSCKAYVKSIDLTRNGHADPIVDELASVALSIWADEHGFIKAEPNLLGM